MKGFIAAVSLLFINIVYAEQPGISWGKNLDQALMQAQKTHQLLILDFYAGWCPPCNQMEQLTYSDKRIITQLKNFIPVKIDIDKQQKLANKYDGNARANGGSGIPATIILDANGKQLAKAHGYLSPEELSELLQKAAINTNKQPAEYELPRQM